MILAKRQCKYIPRNGTRVIQPITRLVSPKTATSKRDLVNYQQSNFPLPGHSLEQAGMKNSKKKKEEKQARLRNRNSLFNRHLLNRNSM